MIRSLPMLYIRIILQMNIRIHTHLQGLITIMPGCGDVDVILEIVKEALLALHAHVHALLKPCPITTEMRGISQWSSLQMSAGKPSPRWPIIN